MENNFSISGETTVWTRPTDSGSKTDCHFCPQCGTRIFHSGHNRPGMITVKGGTLDNPGAAKMVAHIWVRSKQSWLVLSDGLPQVDTQPVALEDWMKLLEGDL